MEYRFLADTGTRVSELCLGAMHFGGPTDESTSVAILNDFVEAGGNFIDTADVYNAGESENVVGRWLKTQDRDRLVIATKVFGNTGDGPNDGGLGRKHIVSAVEASLRRLQTDYIDLYYTHIFDDTVALEQTLSTLDSLVTAGKVRYLGASNVSGWQLQKAVDISRAHGWSRYVALQPLYNLLDRETEWELIPVSLNENIGVMPWSPLRAGWLGGRFTRGMQGPPEGSRIAQAAERGNLERWENYATDHTWNLLDELHAVAAESDRTPAQVAVRWLLQSSGVTAPIIGPRTIDHHTDNLGAAGWRLETAQLERLDAASRKPLPYPYYVHQQHTRHNRR
ncbi:MAG TPA: aldo/keto reductase [Stackebrandtia sp.]|uniref:aldo/keto reductase n=1 Tax=Stackebrandtia sp. TaxID=2023065 RepID=UPI002D226818|nr:aldo/keto reductase [Stackebrandtia sp.]HZE37726.1 aldo/keto reductase [Stackebrandtia sp.]